MLTSVSVHDGATGGAVPAAIVKDPRLSRAQKAAMLALYSTFVGDPVTDDTLWGLMADRLAEPDVGA